MSNPRVLRVTFTGRAAFDITAEPGHPYETLTDQAILDLAAERMREWWEREFPPIDEPGVRVIENVATLNVTTKETP